MNPAFEGMLAGRYLRAKKAESAISVTAWLALIAMALSVATLIVVMSVMNGFHDKLLSRILGLNGHIHIQYPGTAYGDIADDVRALPGVRAVVPLVEGQALASAGHGTAQGAMLRGIAPADFAQQEALAGAVVAGDLADFTGPAVAVGLGLARQMGLRVGAVSYTHL